MANSHPQQPQVHHGGQDTTRGKPAERAAMPQQPPQQHPYNVGYMQPGPPYYGNRMQPGYGHGNYVAPGPGMYQGMQQAPPDAGDALGDYVKNLLNSESTTTKKLVTISDAPVVSSGPIASISSGPQVEREKPPKTHNSAAQITPSPFPSSTNSTKKSPIPEANLMKNPVCEETPIQNIAPTVAKAVPITDGPNPAAVPGAPRPRRYTIEELLAFNTTFQSVRPRHFDEKHPKHSDPQFMAVLLESPQASGGQRGGRDRDPPGRGRREPRAPKDIAAEIGNLAEDSYRRVQRKGLLSLKSKVQYILNRISDENFPEICSELRVLIEESTQPPFLETVEAEIKGLPTQPGEAAECPADACFQTIAKTIHSNAVDQPGHAELFAQLCVEIRNWMAERMKDNVSFGFPPGSKPDFRFLKQLLDNAKARFDEDQIVGAKEALLRPEEGEDVELFNERMIMGKKQRQSNVSFIGHLAENKLINTRIVVGVISDLLAAAGSSDLIPPPKEKIEMVITLLKIVGRTLDQFDPTQKDTIDGIYAHLAKIAALKDGSVEFRVSVLLDDLVNLRHAGWDPDAALRGSVKSGQKGGRGAISGPRRPQQNIGGKPGRGGGNKPSSSPEPFSSSKSPTGDNKSQWPSANDFNALERGLSLTFGTDQRKVECEVEPQMNGSLEHLLSGPGKEYVEAVAFHIQDCASNDKSNPRGAVASAIVSTITAAVSVPPSSKPVNSFVERAAALMPELVSRGLPAACLRIAWDRALVEFYHSVDLIDCPMAPLSFAIFVSYLWRLVKTEQLKMDKKHQPNALWVDAGVWGAIGSYADPATHKAQYDEYTLLDNLESFSRHVKNLEKFCSYAGEFLSTGPSRLAVVALIHTKKVEKTIEWLSNKPTPADAYTIALLQNKDGAAQLELLKSGNELNAPQLAAASMAAALAAFVLEPTSTPDSLQQLLQAKMKVFLPILNTFPRDNMDVVFSEFAAASLAINSPMLSKIYLEAVYLEMNWAKLIAPSSLSSMLDGKGFLACAQVPAVRGLEPAACALAGFLKEKCVGGKQ